MERSYGLRVSVMRYEVMGYGYEITMSEGLWGFSK